MNEEQEGGKILIHDRRRGWYDNRITTGNLLTLLGMLVTVVLGWSALDKNQEVLRTRFDSYVQEQTRREEIRQQLDKIQEQLNRIERQIESRSTEIKRRIGGD